jgi:hypothetical protein
MIPVTFAENCLLNVEIGSLRVFLNMVPDKLLMN